MARQRIITRLVHRILCTLLTALVVASATSAAKAQGYGAIQAVRQRVEGLSGPGAAAGEGRPGAMGPEQPLSPGANGAKLDTSYISPNAAVFLAIRPAQLLTSPIGQTFPTEVVAAAGLKYLGFDLADVEEADAFVDLTNPMAPTYGVTIKFTKPFRANTLSPMTHPSVQLSELNGKKYLQSNLPMWPSFYGPNNRTMVAAPDATLKQLVPNASQPKTGKLLDITRDIPGGNDLYLAVDVTALQPLMQMGMAQAPAKLPPQAKQAVEALKTVSAAELTLNLVAAGPVSLVVHANDEAAAQQIEAFLQEGVKQYQTPPNPAAPGGDDTIQQAMGRYKERMSKAIVPSRNGVVVTCLHIDAQDQAQRQFVGGVIAGYAAASAMPMMQKAPMAPPGPAGDPNAISPQAAAPSGPGGAPPVTQ
jgi:hypothetical protein